MEYFKSSLGGVDKVYAGDPSTGKLTVINQYKNSGMYTVTNMQLQTTAVEGEVSYPYYILILNSATQAEFQAYATLAKNFLSSL